MSELSVEEAVGSSMQVQTASQIHLLGEDQFSGDEYGYLDSPLWVGSDGAPRYSMERWFRLVFTMPFTDIRRVHLWLPQTMPPGWLLRLGTSLTYFTPTTASSTIAATPAPMTRTSEPNVALADNGVVERRTEWIVLQAVVDGDAPSGPPLGYGLDGQPNPLEYHVEWSEL